MSFNLLWQFEPADGAVRFNAEPVFDACIVVVVTTRHHTHIRQWLEVPSTYRTRTFEMLRRVVVFSYQGINHAVRGLLAAAEVEDNHYEDETGEAAAQTADHKNRQEEVKVPKDDQGQSPTPKHRRVVPTRVLRVEADIPYDLPENVQPA